MLIDHVTVAGADLPRLEHRFRAAGLAPDYGGLHSNGITHMSLIGFDDGSYIELISTARTGDRAPWWPAHIAGDGGLCGWCVRTDDIAADCTRLRGAGVGVRGPIAMHRDRPDQARIAWEVAFPGPGEPGTLLPFIIEDHTPREWRVRPSASTAGGDLSGIAVVVIVVADLVWATGLFEQTYGLRQRETRNDAEFGATVVRFQDAPLALATPLHPGGWLARRLERFGDGPVAILFRSRDLNASAARLRPGTTGQWQRRPALWLEIQDLGGSRLGVIPEDK